MRLRRHPGPEVVGGAAMVSDEDVEALMSYVAEGDREALTTMLSGMSPLDRAYMDGYVGGYVEGCRHMLTACERGGASTDVRS